MIRNYINHKDVSTCSKTDCLRWEKIWTTGVINKILFLMEIEFIVARNVARGFIPAKYSEAMVSLQGGDCHPTKRRGTRSGRKRNVRDELWSVLRAFAKITSQNWRPDLGQICSIRNCKATVIAGLCRGLCDWGSGKDGLKMGCENVKLFLRKP